MPTGDGRITNYFPRLTPSSTPRTPTQSLKKQSKRARTQDAEPESSKENSRKKPKGRKKADEEDDLLPSTSAKRNTQSSRKVLKNVIEIQDTPPSSPIKATPFRGTTPPSSPLPMLTPSPESYFSRVASSTTQSSVVDTARTTPSPSMDNSYVERQEIELELIPSSQTQNMDTQFHEDNTDDSITNSPLGYLRSGENCSQTSEPNTISQYLTPPDEIIPSSQTQLMDYTNSQLEDTPISPVEPELDIVLSSQSQELTYSQAALRRLERIASTASERRMSLLDAYLDTPQEVNEHVLENDDQGVDAEPDERPSFISSSQTPVCTSRRPSPHTHESQERDDYTLSSQRSEPFWNEEPSFDESLPEAVKEFQQMFGDDSESYPPDFPESLRE